MRITEKVIVETVVENTKSIICNCCGKEYKITNFESLHQVKLSFGYNSQFDMQTWGMDICENCIIKFIKTFKLVPDKFMSDPSYIEKFDSDHDLHQKLFDEWKISGEWNYDDNPYEESYGDEEFGLDEQQYEEYNNKENQSRKPASQAILKIVK